MLLVDEEAFASYWSRSGGQQAKHFDTASEKTKVFHHPTLVPLVPLVAPRDSSHSSFFALVIATPLLAAQQLVPAKDAFEDGPDLSS